MNRKQLTILVAVGLFLGVIGLVIHKSQRSSFQSTDRDDAEKLLPDFPLNDVTHVLVKSPDSELNLSKVEGKWTIDEREGYPADFSKVGNLLQTVWDLKPTDEVGVGESQLGRIQVEEPSDAGGEGAGTLLEFKDAESKVVGKLVMGKEIMSEPDPASPYGGMAQGRFLRTFGDDPKVVRVTETFSLVRPEPESWISRDFFKIAKAKSIQVSSDSEPGRNWHVERETETGTWTLVDAEVDEELDTTKTSSLNNVLSAPSFSDVSKNDIEPEVNAAITTFEGFQYDIAISAPNDASQRNIKMRVSADIPEERDAPEDESDEDKARLDAEFAATQTTLREKLEKEQFFQNWTYQVSNYTVDALRKNRTDIVKLVEVAVPDIIPETETPEGTPDPDLSDIDPLEFQLPSGSE